MSEPGRQGASLETKEGTSGAIRDFLRKALQARAADAALVPVTTPAGDSYAWILTSDQDLLDEASPVAPTMPVQGAKALRSLTRKGGGTAKVIAVMRPCEIRAAIELSKLNQVRLDDIILLSYDCPGAIPLKDHVRDPEGSAQRFAAMLEAGKTDDSAVRQVCTVCVDFALVGSDIHFATLGTPAGSVMLVPRSDRGSALLETMGIPCKEDTSGWMEVVTGLKARREDRRRKALAQTGAALQGFDGLRTTFADCIGCRNCQSACPICYCRQCYFDSEMAKPDPAAVMDIALRRGGMAFPANRVMFHTGRMTHMSLSCVSCGQCSDACPAGIPVADVFSYIAGLTQSTFDYVAGRDGGEPLPLRHFEEDEIAGVHEIVKSAEEEEVAHE
jgi:formate dehydrogenase subunit beta